MQKLALDVSQLRENIVSIRAATWVDIGLHGRLSSTVRLPVILVLVLLMVACAGGGEEATATPVLHQRVSSPSPSPTAMLETATAVEAVWSVPLGGAINVAPLVSRDLAIVATANGQIHAVEAATGALAWNFSPEDEVWDASLIASDQYVCAGLKGGQLTCLDSESGQQRWTKDLGLEVQSRPALIGDALYAPTTLVGPGLENNFDGEAFLIALDARDGEEIWRATAGTYILRRPVVAGDLVITGGTFRGQEPDRDHDPTRLIALNREGGHQQWVYESEDGLLRWLVATDTMVAFAARTEIVHALDLANGELLWSFGPSYWMQFPAANGENLYFGTGDEIFWSLDAATADVIWEHRIELSNLNQIGRPIIKGDQVLFNAVTGDIYSLSLADGHSTMHLKTGYSSRVGGAVYESLYIMGDPDGNLHAFEIR